MRRLLALTALLGFGCNNDLSGKGFSPEPVAGADDGDDGGTDGTDGADGGGDGGDGGGDGGDGGDGGGNEVDNDNDGWTVEQGDCDDDDPDVNPGMEELCNGVDDNCDGFSDADEDDDGDGIPDCEDNCPVQVDVRATATPDGTWDAPYPEIQQGIDEAWAASCSDVEVADGTYYENIDYGGADVYVSSHYGPDATIIDGSSIDSVVRFVSGESNASGIKGFTIQNGAASLGGGIRIEGADPVIGGNEIVDNGVVGDGGGGGIGMLDAFPLIVNNIIQDNNACYGGPEEGCDGGGLNVRGGGPTIVDNLILDNSAGDGGGMWMVRSDANIYWNVFDGNQADDTDPDTAGQGGGVDIQIGSEGTLFTNNIVTNNVASTHGGGVAVFELSAAYGNAEVSHNVIAYNSVVETTYGGGLLAWGSTAPIFHNNLVAWNDGGGIWLNATADARYNLVYGNSTDWLGSQGSLTGVAGNISMAPGVAAASDDGDWTNDDWHPGSSGAAIVDAGDPGGASDADGSRADIGAYGGVHSAW